MDDEASGPVKRIRLTGSRFDGGRLPVDSLVELERYQRAVRSMAAAEWRREHPGEQLPESFDESVSLAIEEIRPGSADVFLAFEQQAVYAGYAAEARDAVDATIEAAFKGDNPLPPLPDDVREEVRGVLAGLGDTLSPDQTIEFYVDNQQPPVLITVATRESATARLLLDDFFIDAPAQVENDLITNPDSLLAHVTVIDADHMSYQLSTPEFGRVIGHYKNDPELLDDLRAVVNSRRDGPLTRIHGELQYRGGRPWRFKETSRVEQIEFEATEWGRLLARFGALRAGWAGGDGTVISAVALEAARAVLLELDEETSLPTMAPTPEGGVVLEWISSSGVKSIEVLDDGSYELFTLQVNDELGQQTETSNAAEAAAFANEALA